MTPQDYVRTQTVKQLSDARASVQKAAETPAEAAQQFEEILVRQLVKVMTKDLFDASPSGQDGPQWMQGQRDTQRDLLTDMLTKHLAASDALPVADHLTQQWDEAAPAPDLPIPDAAEKAPTLPPTDLEK